MYSETRNKNYIYSTKTQANPMLLINFKETNDKHTIVSLFKCSVLFSSALLKIYLKNSNSNTGKNVKFTKLTLSRVNIIFHPT